MSAAGRSSSSKFAREENQWCSDKARAAQQPETIEESKERGLAEYDSRQFGFGVYRSVRGGESVRGEVLRDGAERLPVTRRRRRGMFHQDGLMVLRAARQKRCDERNAHAASLI